MTPPRDQPSELERQLMLIGPQRQSESLFAARARFHQSWYRYYVLGLERYGRTSGANNGCPLGSILAPEDSQAGKNFISDHSQQLYLERRQNGWGVDPVRCTSYLTSSQAMTINILGSMAAHQDWMTRVYAILLKKPIKRIIDTQIEYAPKQRIQLLGDRTILDAWIIVETNTDIMPISMEVKYIDRFNSRYIDPALRPKYIALADRSNLWNPTNPLFRSRRVNQLLRCHALGAAIAYDRSPGHGPPLMILIHHPDDQAAKDVLDGYRQLLRDELLLLSIPLDTLFKAMKDSAAEAEQHRIADELRLRYIGYTASQVLWNEYRSYVKQI
ncbi:hypothetical protein ABZW11_14245 [Nonomuraea sp. NPDC004580]|uniref:PGN_0703 family putative restriction endonuclease n=1 Tax=Nonomuraea sp. NPDC004580 TaxID=3154552 RepID=UPI0033A47B93